MLGRLAPHHHVGSSIALGTSIRTVPVRVILSFRGTWLCTPVEADQPAVRLLQRQRLAFEGAPIVIDMVCRRICIALGETDIVLATGGHGSLL